MMRRKEREIAELSEIRAVMDRCDACRLAISTGGAPYIVPLNFGYEEEDGKFTLYFHSAMEGRKLELMKKHPKVGFEMDCSHRLIAGAEACKYSFAFQSIIGAGTVRFLEEPEEKLRGLKILMKHFTMQDLPFSDAVVARTQVLAMEVNTLTCKGK